MKSQKFLLIILLAVLGFVFSFSDTGAQKKKLTYKQVFESGMGMRGMMTRTQNWLDEDHYLEAKPDPSKPGSRGVVMKVSASDGKSEVYFDYSSIKLPEGFSIDRSTLISPDNNYFLFVQKNNLFYYSRPDNSFTQ